jgi:hypothetical protein
VGSGGSSGKVNDSNAGCSCTLGAPNRSSFLSLLVLAAAGWMVRSRRRGR